MKTSIERATHQTWLLFGLVVVLLFSLITAIFVSLVFNKERTDAATQTLRATTNAENITASLACVTDWAHAYSQRAAYIQTLADRRVTALDTLAHALIAPTSAQRVQAAVKVYLATSAAYTAGVKAHPVPQAPTLACHITPFTPPPAPKPGPTVTKTVATPGPTRTVTVLGPTVVVPGPRATVHVPGPTRTVVCHGRHC